MDAVRPFKHRPGDGRHLINQRVIASPFQLGDPSDICVVLNAHRLLSRYGLRPIWQYWTEHYPQDPMTEADAQIIFCNADSYTEPVDLEILDERTAILDDVVAIGCQPLADKIRHDLKTMGAIY